MPLGIMSRKARLSARVTCGIEPDVMRRQRFFNANIVFKFGFAIPLIAGHDGATKAIAVRPGGVLAKTSILANS